VSGLQTHVKPTTRHSQRSTRVASSVALLFAIASVACAGSPADVPARMRWATPAEMQWMRGVRSWRSSVLQWVEQINSPLDATYRRGLRGLRSCTRTLRSEAGSPPARLRSFENTFLGFCSDWENASRQLSHGGGRADLQTRMAAPDRAYRVALALLPLSESRPLRTGRIERRESASIPWLTAIAKGLSANVSHVRCWSPRDWTRLLLEERAVGALRGAVSAFANPQIGSIDLQYATCAALRRTRSGEPPLTTTDATAVVTLAHEVEHIAGYTTDAVAECRAMQLIPTVAFLMSLPLDVGRALAKGFWKYVYPQDPKELRTPSCRNGGRLDMHPGSSSWP
jgi:hypothetical protein